jgi:hypothetical protein
MVFVYLNRYRNTTIKERGNGFTGSLWLVLAGDRGRTFVFEDFSDEFADFAFHLCQGIAPLLVAR